jgi:uncharacterized protein involved in outer membrane biogenesis
MKILKIVAGVAAVLIAGVVVALMTVDVSQYKGVIQDQAKAATGREVTIGDIKLSLSLSPAIVVTDVKVANAPWGSRPQMLTAKSLEAQTQLVPLLFGTVNISGLKLVDPDVILETDAQGKGNWEFTPATQQTTAAPGDSPDVPPLNISGVAVEGLKLAYRDGQTKTNATLAAKTADVDIDGPLAEMNIPSVAVTEASVSYSQGSMSGHGAAKDLILEATGPITDFNVTKLMASDVKGTFKDGGSAYDAAVATLTMEGAARTVGTRPKTVDPAAALKAMNLTTLTVEKVMASMKDPQTTVGASIGKVTVQAKGPIGQYGISNLVLTDSKLSHKTGADPAFEADIATLSLDQAGALALNAKVGGQDVKASGTLAPIATLAAGNKSFPAKLAFEGMGLKGTSDLTVNVANNRPSARGSVNIPELDLSAYTSSGSATGGAVAPANAGGKVFSKEPLPWDSLAGNDANVTVVIGKLTLPNALVLTNVNMPVTLAGGRLAVNGATFHLAGGSVTSDIIMDANGKAFALKTEAKGLTAETIAREMRKADLITQGPLDVNINVRGTGNSSADIAATMSGSAIIGMGESRIRSGALNIVGVDIIMQVLGALNPVGNNDPYTVSRCGVVNLQIANGVATTNNGIALVTDKMQLTSSGIIDFRSENVDLNFRPRATGGLGVGLGALAQAVKVSGPLSSPGIGVDKGGALKTLGTLGAAFATGGASILAQSAKDRVDGSGDPCQTARTWHLKR